MSSTFTVLHVSILHSLSVAKSPIPREYLLFIVVHVTNMYVYLQYIQDICQSRLGTADHALSHVAYVTTAA
jgi:hypothetical protein